MKKQQRLILRSPMVAVMALVAAAAALAETTSPAALAPSANPGCSRAPPSAAALRPLLAVAARNTKALRLHVASPDWRDQVIYFALSDRFADGDPCNNDQGTGEFGPGKRSRYQGGDLAGLRQHLAYIQGLGATALWITPPVANQWVNPSGDYFGYHGYWAQHFMQVDPHLGTLADYQQLSDALHRRGMYLVQDIVVNHVGNYFSYGDRWQPGDPAAGWEAHDRTAPVPRPSQPPFNLNDPRDPRQRRAAIYHWTPDVRDYSDPAQAHGFQMSGLDDLNTENPVVRRALRRSYGHWIRAVGVDAFRIDTAFYVPPDYFDDFLNATDAAAPGVLRVARSTGRRQFHLFGEGFGLDQPGQDVQARKIERYITGPRGQPLLPGMLNFPLYGSLGEVFARGRPPAELADRIQRTMKLHRQPQLMANFIDNHDVDRFGAGASEAGLRQALLALFTLPGIPVIYYGTEQGLTESRASMFAAGWGSGGSDRFDTQAPLYRYLAQLAALRREHRVLSRGVPRVLQANAARPGALAWKMEVPKGNLKNTNDRSRVSSTPLGFLKKAGTDLLVLFNTAGESSLAARLETGWPAGSRLRAIFDGAASPGGPTATVRVGATPPQAAELVVGPQGRLSVALAPHSAQVWQLLPADGQPGATRQRPGALRTVPLENTQASTHFRVDDLPIGSMESGLQVKGSSPLGSQPLLLVLDGDLSRAQTLQPDEQGRWQARLDTGDLIDPAIEHEVTAWHAASGTAASAQRFRVQPRWLLQADVEDPAGDDVGPNGLYSYPTDPGYEPYRQMDLRRVRAYTSGSSLRLDLQMNAVTQTWNPANGFDHVAFTIFIELPGQAGGATVMPLQDGDVPEGFRWHLRLRSHGWSNALFSAEGASDSAEGRPVAGGAVISVDRLQRQISFTLPASSFTLGANATSLAPTDRLRGARIWVTTWDYDGGYRALLESPQAFAMGGRPAGGGRAAKLMDSSAIITLP